MTAKVLKVVDVQNHPNADSLKVYQMSAGDKQIQIIANLENQYNVGDHVKVVLAPCVMHDGVKIKETKIRGVLSSGMALGKTDLEVGIDLTAELCKEEVPEVEIKNGPLDKSIKFIKWPSIEQLQHVRRNISITNSERAIKYLAKCKEHGTNSGVACTKEGTFRAQKRSSLISLESDNAGFCRFVEERKDYFSNVKQDVTIFGEFIGKSVQKGTVIDQLPEKYFCIFGLYYKDIEMIDVNPETISKALGTLPSNVYILPFYGEEIILDFRDLININDKLTILNNTVLGFEKEDPWIKSVFNVTGKGEGLVYYPISECETDDEGRLLITRSRFEKYGFKAKTNEFAVTHGAKAKKPVQIDVELVKSVKEFAKMFVTENRLNQIAGEIGFDHKKTGEFLAAFMRDVFKESQAELEKAKLTSKQVSKEVGNAARLWYMSKLNEGINV